MRIGFRRWNIKMNGMQYQLYPANASYHAWNLLGANQAKESNTNILSYPQANINKCGFYHYYDISGTTAYSGVLGACMCWGRMAGKDSERIFRAEFAQILALVKPKDSLLPSPSSPMPSSDLTNHYWMLRFSDDIAESDFNAYVSGLLEKIGEPNLEKRDLYSLFIQHKDRIKQLDIEFKESCQAFHSIVKLWNPAIEFKNQMPFPVFDTEAQLVDYAKKFGDLGPPDRKLISDSQHTDSAPDSGLDLA